MIENNLCRFGYFQLLLATAIDPPLLDILSLEDVAMKPLVNIGVHHSLAKSIELVELGPYEVEITSLYFYGFQENRMQDDRGIECQIAVVFMLVVLFD